MRITTKASVLALLVLALSLALIACGPAGTESETADETTDVASEAEAEDHSTEQEADSAPEDTQPVIDGVIAELEYIEIEAGTGAQAEAGDQVAVHYTGTLEDGTVFDSSVERGQPIEFVLGRGNVIPGWDQGIAMMREGGKATLIIPPNLGYGTQGAGDVIPPNAILTFEVELVSVTKPQKPTEIDAGDFDTMESGVLVYEMAAGDGDEITEGDRIAVHFIAWVQGGDMLASTYDRGAPVYYTYGEDDFFLNEWVDALAGMQVGGQRQIVVPVELGSEVVPPGETLVLELELAEIAEPVVRTEVDEADLITSDTGLQYFDIAVGDGETAEAGAIVTLNYVGWLNDEIAHFDSTYERGEPVEFPLGTGSIIPGWDEGIEGMQVGGKRLLVIPPALGFGETGTSGIPGDATLTFEIELLEVTPGVSGSGD